MSSNKNKWSNLIIALSLMLLLGTSVVAMERAKDQTVHQKLSEQRIRQSEDLVSSEPSGSVAEQIPLGEAEIISEELSEVYAYSENKNKEWLAINPEFMGWLQVPGTEINYPFVRGQDNTHYLKHDFYQEYSESGSLFMDYRNLGNFNDQHSLIYGHNMETRFHALVNYQNADFLAENPYIILSGLYETKTYKIFSVYEVSADDYEFTLAFENDSAYEQYLKELEAISLHPQSIELDIGQKLLSLVTCGYGNNTRIIVHAIEISNSIGDVSISTAEN